MPAAGVCDDDAMTRSRGRDVAGHLVDDLDVQLRDFRPSTLIPFPPFQPFLHLLPITSDHVAPGDGVALVDEVR